MYMKPNKDDKQFLKDVIDYLQFQEEMPLCWMDENGEVARIILPGILDELLENKEDIDRFERLYIEHLNESTANAKRIMGDIK